MRKFDKVEYWELLENPQEETYKRLMKVLCDHSDKFYFVTRKELSYNEEIIAQYKPYFLEIYKTKKWAGTETTGPEATVYVVEINKETYKMLISHANSLFEWVAPELPEDLTFIKNEFEWFFSTTHEEFAAFSIRSEYYKNIMMSIEGLKLEKVE